MNKDVNEAPIFSRRLLIGAIAAAVTLFVCSLYLMGGNGSNKRGSDTVGTNTFSRSAIGHAGIAEILRKLGVTVVQSQHDSLDRLGPTSVLVIAEPPLTVTADEQVRALLKAHTVLFVLPKWAGLPSTKKIDWIDRVLLKPTAEAEWALQRVVNRGEVVRPSAAQAWTVNVLGGAPELGESPQLVQSDRLRTLLGSAEGTLVGEAANKQHRIWVLADPDVLSNHGIAQPANAAFAVGLINALRGPDGSVVFDETIHGFVAAPANPWKLFEPPFVFVVPLLAVAIGLLLWATMPRFGAPEKLPPPLASGKLALIGSAAKLIAFAGYQRVLVKRYVQSTIREGARELHAPRGLSEFELVEWLRRIGQARNVSIDCGTVLLRAERLAERRRGEASSLVAAAREIHQWKREIIDGPANYSRDHRRAANRGPQSGRGSG